jgi:phage shock protein PspC (stress-responsive transcriptional regulator)
MKPELVAMIDMRPQLVAVIVVALILVALWDGVWKLIAMWKSARHNQLPWFICLAIFNTAGVLPILYILLFQKLEPSTPRTS